MHLKPRSNRNHFLLSLIMLLFVSLLVTSCDNANQNQNSNNNSQSDTTNTDTSQTDNTQNNNDTSSTTDTPDVEETVLRIATQATVNLDPAFVSSDQEVAFVNAVYDYLVDVDAANRIQPRLAKSWTVSEDGMTYTFALEENVTFHDGSAFTAEDVAWTFVRLRNPEVGSGAASLYENVVSIEANGDNEVVFTLSGNDPFFLFDLSDNRAVIVKNGTDDTSDHNGTGPFKVENISTEDRIELSANGNYFMDGKPMLDRLDFIFFADSIAAVDALKGGQVDLVWRMPNALYLSLEPEANIDTTLVPTNSFISIRMHSDTEPGNNPQVVQAIKLALDREAMLNAAALGMGTVGNDTPIGPLYADYHAPLTMQPDVEQAKTLMADAGFADGLSLELYTPDTLGMPDVAVLVKDQLSQIGINVDVVTRPENVYYSDEWLSAPFGMTSWGSRPVPQFYLDVMLVCEGKWNESKFCNEEFDQLAQTTATTLDEQERIDAYKRMQEILQTESTMIVPYYFAQNAAIRSNFEGFELKAFVGRTDFRGVKQN